MSRLASVLPRAQYPLRWLACDNWRVFPLSN